MKEFIVQDLIGLRVVSEYLAELMSQHSVFLLNGDLGAGKTTLVKDWMQCLGIKETISSPTYSIVNEYRLMDKSIYHMDMYRLKTIEEALDIGIEDYLFNSSAHSIIEWPGLIMDLIELPYAKITIGVHSEDQRHIQIESFLNEML